MPKGTRLILGIAAAIIVAAGIVMATPLRDLIFIDRPGGIGGMFAVCGAPGQSCCKWPNALPGFNPSYCDAGAGCDIATNTCVTPCGAGGQVCCDGPDTYAPQGDSSPTGAFFCRNGDCKPRRQMCDSGSCVRETRRCNDQCGKTAGAACCPPDASVGVASCKSPDLVCEGPSHASGTCVRCGEQGQPPCVGGECRISAGVRTMERNGICVACGIVGLPKCPSAPRCDAGGAPDPHGPNCIPGGGKDQPCLEGKFCGYDGMFCDNTNVCRVCGAPGEPCCPNQPLLGGGFTKECGGYSNLQCANFNGRRVCQYKPGQAPGQGSPPPPPPGPKTCGGNDYQFGVTTTYPVWIRDGNGCAGVGAAYQANSPAEAIECAKTVYGTLVIEEPVEQYTMSMDGPGLGCRTVQVWAKDEDDAGSCAQSLCLNCDEPVPGATCP
jgi:hypothetical protein